MESLAHADGGELQAETGSWSREFLFASGGDGQRASTEDFFALAEEGTVSPPDVASLGCLLCGLCLLLSGTLLAFAVIERCALLLQSQQLPGAGSGNAAAVTAAYLAAHSRGSALEVFLHHARMLEAIVRELVLNFSRKAVLWTQWLLVLFLSNDKRGLESFVRRSRLKASSASVVKRKRLVIVRHGESVWNLVFNRGILTLAFIPRLAMMCLCELLLLWEADSVLLDSPLSTRGIEQAVSIRSVISKIKPPTPSSTGTAVARAGGGSGAPAASSVGESSASRKNAPSALQGDSSSSPSQEPASSEGHTPPAAGVSTVGEEEQQPCFSSSQKKQIPAEEAVHEDPATTASPPASVLFLTSNLRRAASTLLLCAGPRLEAEDCTAKVCSSLQEATRNPDGFPLTPARRAPLPSRLEAALLGCGAGLKLRARLGVEGNTGPQGVRSPPLWRRLQQTAFEICAAPEAVVVAVGHSLWVRTFFRAFSDPQHSHVACKKKLSNCGVLSLELCLLQDPKTGEEDFLIDAESVHLLHGHFV